MRIAGSNRPNSGLYVDYKDVLDQAVANARLQVLQQVRSAVETIGVDYVDPKYPHRRINYTAEAFRKAVRTELTRLETP